MLPLHLDHSAGSTLQDQIYRKVSAAILSGQLKPGSALPSSRELAQQLRVSRNTIVLAFERLANEGYLRMRSGSGTFVTDVLPEDCVAAETPKSLDPAATTVATAEQETVSYPPVLLQTDVLRMAPHGPSDHKVDFKYCSSNWRNFPLREWRQLLIENMSRTSANISGYGTPEGLLELRKAIAAHVSSSRAVVVDPEQVVVTVGAQEALNLVSRLFVQPSVRVAVENPCYRGAALVFQSYGATLVPLSVDDEGARTDALEGSGASLIYVTPSHQFPTGVTMSRDRRFELLQWAEKNGAYIIEDDYDSDFRYDGPPIAALAGLNRNRSVIYLGTFSKSIGSGLRTGYVIVPHQLIEPMRRAKSLANCGNPWMEQIVLADFLNNGGFTRHLRRIRESYRQTRAALLDALEEHFGGTEISGTAGGMHLMWTLPSHYPTGKEVANIAAAAGVGVYPIERAGAYEIGPTQYPRSLVLGFALLSPEAARNGVSRIANGLMAAGVRLLPLSRQADYSRRDQPAPALIVTS
jgi:GntR family transcriptional regulator/MocR family aminotransferase